jgi:phage terminase large subunit-like protein
MAFADGEVGAEVWIGANSMDQAKAVFTPAQKMASIPEFIEATGVEVRAMSVVQESTGNFVQPMIGKPKDGTNPHCAILDEAHEADSSVAYDAMKTGMGARSQPLLITITTAGVNLAGPCKLQQSYAESVLAGQVDNPRLFAAIWTIDQKDDWKDFECWKKANPNLGVSIFEQNLQAAYTEALQRPEKAAMAQTKHLNRWVSSRSAWLNMVDWSKAADTTLDLSKLAKRPATIGTDLATKSDLAVVTARVELEDGRIALFPFCFLPEGALTRAKNSESYQQWREKGHLIVTEGEATDFSEIKAKLLELNSQLAVRMNAFDGWQAQQMMQELMAEGLPVTEVRANVQNFSTPMRDFEAMLLRGELVHPDNLCMNWMAGNVVAKEDARGNLYPRKPDNQPHLKIDGIVTALMAEAVAQEPEPEDNEPFVFIL